MYKGIYWNEIVSHPVQKGNAAHRLWQKEASDKSPKSEKVMFLNWT